MKRCIVITHGPIGDALITAAEGIIGKQPGLFALSVTEMSASEIRLRLEALVNGPDEKDGVYILASLRGGSCWNVAAEVAKGKPHVVVISGANLSMLLSFITKRDALPFHELADTIKRDGIRGIEKLEL